MAGRYGFSLKVGVGTASPVTRRLNFFLDTLAAVEQHDAMFGLAGTLREPGERNRVVARRCAGQLGVWPNPIELNDLLRWMLGGAPLVGTPAGKTTFPVGDTDEVRFVTSDRGEKVFTFDNVGVDAWELASVQAGPLSLTLDLVAKDVADGAQGTFPALEIDRTQRCFAHSDLVFTLNGVPHKVPEIRVRGQHSIDTDRQFNSLTLTSVQKTQRLITLSTRIPWGDGSAAHNLSANGVTADATWTNGALSLQLVFASVHIPREDPVSNARGELFLPVNGVCKALGTVPGTTDEISAILDLTP